MRVLFALRKNWQRKYGGDLYQCRRYVHYLERSEIPCEIIRRMPSECSKDTILHAFNIDRIADCYYYMQCAKRLSIPFCITPIHHPSSYVDQFDLYHSHLFIRSLRRVLRSQPLFQIFKDSVKLLVGQIEKKGYIYELTKGQKSMAREILHNSKRIFILAPGELHEIEKDFDIRLRRHRIVETINGYDMVSPNKYESLPSETRTFIEEYKKFAIVCGRIEPRKNQIGVLNALSESKIPIVFAGAFNSHNRSYTRKFMEMIQKIRHWNYAGLLSEGQLATLYSDGHMLILYSWFEVTPLVEIEAYGYGCHVLTTSRSYSPSYGKGRFLYVDPDSPKDLLKSAKRVWESETPKVSRQDAFIEQFSWEITSQTLIRNYQEIVRS